MKILIPKKISLNDLILVFYTFVIVVTNEGSMLMKIARALLFFTFIISLIKRKQIILNQYIIWLLAFCIFSFASTFWAQDLMLAKSMTKTLIINLICMYSYLYLLNSNIDKIDLVLNCLIISSLFLGVRVLISAGPFAYFNARIAAGISGNTLGICSAFAASICIFYILNSKNKFYYSLLFAMNILIMILSSSRKAIICCAIPILILYIFNKSRKNNILKIMIRLTVAFLVIILIYEALMNISFLYETVGNRIQSMLLGFSGDSSSIDSSSKTRFNLIIWGLEWFKNKIWIGYGIDNYRAVLTYFHPDYPITFYAHNNYVELLVDLGVIGTLIYYYIYICIIYKGITKFKSLNDLQLLFLGILFAILFSEFGLVSYFDRYTQILLLITWVVFYRNKKCRCEDELFE